MSSAGDLVGSSVKITGCSSGVGGGVGSFTSSFWIACLMKGSKCSTAHKLIASIQTMNLVK